MQVSKIKKQLKRPFDFFKRKTEKPREFMTKGRAGAMIAEFLLAAQFFIWIADEFTLKKLHIILVILISAVLIFLLSELINLIIRIAFGGKRRSKGYFLTALCIVGADNYIGTQGQAASAVILMTLALVVSADILGRCLWGFFKERRFKQVFGYIASLLAVSYMIFYGVFFRNDFWGESRIDFYTGIRNASDTGSASAVPGFERYLENGAYKVCTLSYGPGEDSDIVTETVDYSGFDSMDERGLSEKITGFFSDYDFAQTPVKGEIWYPENMTECPVLFFVHGNHDSDVPSYLGYDYLGEYLASNGYVVISVDENIINELGEGNDKRAILLLDNMKVILGENDDPESAIYNLIDPDRIVIGGHSRGGEMAATAYLFNDLERYPEDGNVRFDYHFNITSIVAVAPCVDQYRPVRHSVEISDVNYLLIHGSNDQDVSSMMGEKQYNNVTFTDAEEHHFKSSVYILGANHGQFNSLWGRYDMAGATNGYLSTNHFLDEAGQKLIAKAYIRSFLDATIGEDDTYYSLLCDTEGYEEYLPDTVYITNYVDSDYHSICSFDDTVDLRGSESDVTVNAEDTNTWTITPYSRGNGGESEDYVLSMSWPEETEPVCKVYFPEIDISGGYMAFRIADMREDTADIPEYLDYTVTLTDSLGNTVSSTCPEPVYHSLAVQLYKQD
ncbi:MAG: hypothetical protein K6F65_08305, partial [Lachnospiraceae bacterium]|nr:hypothetical protein [Lachnospiraceae bacterium]